MRSKIRLLWSHPSISQLFHGGTRDHTFNDVLFAPMHQLHTHKPCSPPTSLVDIPTRELRSFHMDSEIFIAAIKRELFELTPKIPSAEQMADRLFISSRTFSRRLNNAGQDYRSIVSEVRRSLAIAQLTESGEKISVIAKHLGYADTANFTKAFKIWTGLSPKNYRKAHSL